jgi:hypothetical protein
VLSDFGFRIADFGYEMWDVKLKSLIILYSARALEGWHLPSAYARSAVLAGRRSIGPKVVAARAADVASLSSNMGHFCLL